MTDSTLESNGPISSATASSASIDANSTKNDSTTTAAPMTDDASSTTVPAIRMKKVRKRGAFKSSTTPLEDEAEDAAEQTHLAAIRAIQDLRAKKAGAVQLGESALHLPDREMTTAAAASSAPETLTLNAAPSLGQEFGAQGASSGDGGKDAQTKLIEEQMEKYIAEQMEQRRQLRQPQKKNDASASSSSSSTMAGQSTTAQPALNLSEDQLFVTPAHLAIAPQPLDEVEESGERWLTGISEQPLSMKDKMANIEKTEQAKAAFLAAEAARRKAAEQALILPANYNANFKLHKKEWDGLRREEFRAWTDAQNRLQAAQAGVPMPEQFQSQRQQPTLQQQVNALPGFLAGGDHDQRRDFSGQSRVGGQGGRGNDRGGNVQNATDDRVVDRFIKRFKFK